MSTDYNYDDQGQFFPFFILTMAGLITFPLTYNLLKPSRELESNAPRIKSDFKPAENDIIQAAKTKQWRRERRLKRIIATLAGYAVMGWMVYLIVVTQRIIPKIWDPYNILDISRSASEKAIKKQYRRLTLQYHPDKVTPDPALNQTIESITEFYVEISKAYKALTDEEVRNNYIQYGHPDGKQSFSIGIALPKTIITEGHGKYVLLVYGLLLGVLLPYVVGKWWYGTQKVTKDKVLVASAGNLFQEYDEEASQGQVLKALTSGEEYKESFKGAKVDSGLGALEEAILVERGGLATEGMSAEDREQYQNMEGVRRKILALLWSYLQRIQFQDPVLDSEKYEVAPLALTLNDAFISICLAYGHLPALLNAYRVSQHIIQAMAPGASPLLQLPHVTPALAAAVAGGEHQRAPTLQQFMDRPEYVRRKQVTDAPARLRLDPAQYNAAVAVARQLPALRVAAAFFKCRGERHIVTGSLVQFVVKARVVPPGTLNVPDPTPAEIEDPDPPEDGDLPAPRTTGARKGVTRVSDADTPGDAVPPLAHAPYFPRDHSPRWHLLLADARGQRVVVPPATFSTLDRPPFDADGRPSLAVQTLKLQFAAPPQAGSYTFAMHLVCDSYVGMDEKREVTLVVEDARKAMEIESEEEISEPEEDSIAGQLEAMKRGGAAPPTRRRAKPKPVEDSDESNTEGSEDDDTSETDTDTDGE